MSLGVPEITLIIVIILLLFGSKKIPELARALGKSVNEYKQAKNALQNEKQKYENMLKEEDLENDKRKVDCER